MVWNYYKQKSDRIQDLAENKRTFSEILKRARDKRVSLEGINHSNYRDYMNKLWKENIGWRILDHYMVGYDGLNGREEKRIAEEIWNACHKEILGRLVVLFNN